MASKIVTTLKKEIVPIVAINAAGFLEPKLDNFINTNPTLGKLIGSNATMNPNAAYAKYMKATVYTLLGLGVAIAADHMKGGEKMKPLKEGASLFFYGLSGATIAEDPVFNVPSPGYATAGAPQAAYGGVSATPARQVVSRTGNFIS